MCVKTLFSDCTRSVIEQIVVTIIINKFSNLMNAYL